MKNNIYEIKKIKYTVSAFDVMELKPGQAVFDFYRVNSLDKL